MGGGAGVPPGGRMPNSPPPGTGGAEMQEVVNKKLVNISRVTGDNQASLFNFKKAQTKQSGYHRMVYLV